MTAVLKIVDVVQATPLTLRKGERILLGIVIKQRNNDGKPTDHTMTISNEVANAYPSDNIENLIESNVDISLNTNINYITKGIKGILLAHLIDTTNVLYEVGKEYTLQFKFDRDGIGEIRIAELFFNVVESKSPFI